jgi:hypothetical protein
MKASLQNSDCGKLRKETAIAKPAPFQAMIISQNLTQSGAQQMTSDKIKVYL